MSAKNNPNSNTPSAQDPKKKKRITKRLRFEVFKRDKFTCQYCGRSAPDVVLHVDHIVPTSKGGETDIMNLVTACADYNLGKSNVTLADDSVIKQRKRQLDELQSRREQIDMMMQWQKELLDLEQSTTDQVADIWATLAAPYVLTDAGRKSLASWIKRFGIADVIEAMKASISQYVKYGEDEKPIHETVDHAFSYIPRICGNKRRMAEKPYLSDLYYVRGIVRNRLSYVNDHAAIELLERAYEAGIDVERMKTIAKEAKSWTAWRTSMEQEIANHGE